MKQNHKKSNLLIHLLLKSTLTIAALLIGGYTWAQTLVAGWDFQTAPGTAVAAAPNSPTSFTASFGSGVIYFDGTNGSSAWVTASSGNQLTGFTGTAVNAGTGFSTTTTSPASVGLVGGTAEASNGHTVVFKFSMTNLQSLIVSYATQGTATGFNSQAWDYSTDGSTWTSFAAVTTIPTSFATQTLPTVTGLDNAATAYLRLTLTGASSTSGNNRLDNIQLNATLGSVPVTLLSFDVQKATTGNVVSWVVTNTENFSHFEIESSTDGKTFQTIKSILPNTSGHYLFNDNNILPANIYYRLKMVDQSGAYSYSKIDAVVNGSTGFVVGSIYPTVTSSTITIEAYAASSTSVVCKISNMAGQQVWQGSYIADRSSKQTINIDNLPNGVYMLNLSDGNAQHSYSYKIIKQ